jgi:hypothetical protein
MDGDILDLHSLLWSRLLVHVDLFQIIQHLDPLDDLPKHGVVAVQMRRGCQGNEKLAPIGIRALVRHADYPPRIVSQCRPDFVLEQTVRGVVVDGRRRLGLGVRRGRAGLHDEVGDDAVEGAVKVEVGGAEGEEVFGRLGDRLAEELELDVAFGRVQRDGHDAGNCRCAYPGRGTGTVVVACVQDCSVVFSYNAWPGLPWRGPLSRLSPHALPSSFAANPTAGLGTTPSLPAASTLPPTNLTHSTPDSPCHRNQSVRRPTPLVLALPGLARLHHRSSSAFGRLHLASSTAQQLNSSTARQRPPGPS